jgi:hypothetical protein
MLTCLLTWMTGCRMCASNFDYCGPTVMGECDEECGLCAPRAGSILAGASQAASEQVPEFESEPMVPGQLGRNAFEAPIMPKQMVHGEEIEGIIISIEDHKAEEVAEPQTLNVSSAKPAPTPATGSDGWSKK